MAALSNNTSLGTLARAADGTADITYNTASGGALISSSAVGTLGHATFASASAFAGINAAGLIGPVTPNGSDYTATTATTDFDATTSGTFTNSAVGTIRFATPAATTATTNGTLSVANGGILVTSAVGANASTIAGGTITSGNGADLIVQQYNNVSGGALTITSGIVDGTAATALTKAGPGTLVMDGPNSYTGATFINGGTLQVGNADTAGGLSAGAVLDNGTLVFNRTDTVTSANFISGTGGLVMIGTGILVLSQSDNFAGGTTLNAGTVQFATTDDAGTGGFTFDGGALRRTATLTTGRLFTFNAGGGTVDASAGAVFTLTTAGPCPAPGR